ncbi:hypothetical protein HMN09_00253200 [Mycena chlorophos]|uniref:NmrA-like domain-containing protein n=1 Tax=Mycena chlorophos TaxID=658473 RepID=A0A8H6TM04_MYCCL|nr:hypothetical protein HMN09_00253200 [Mycena chlorophos]
MYAPSMSTYPARTEPQTIFFLGATGYLGSVVLAQLAEQAPQHKVVVLLRPGGSSVSTTTSPVPGAASVQEKLNCLKLIHPNIVGVVEGSLDDKEAIAKACEEVDLVLNCASSDHLDSVEATLEGLERNSAAHPGRPPIYIHVSGCGILSDNARGEFKKAEDIPEYSDIGFDLKSSVPQTNMHLPSDIPIFEAGIREKNPIRSLILFPGQIYGIATAGGQPTTLWIRIFLSMARAGGFVGTWGPGHNSMNNIHVVDVASATTLLVLRAIAGTAPEGKDGIYFCGSMERKVPYREWTELMGNILYEKGYIKEKGTRPLAETIVEPLGHYGWSLLGGNQFARPERLATLGWEPVETAKQDMMASLPLMIEQALSEVDWVPTVQV